MKPSLLFFTAILFTGQAFAQCTQLGQNPSTAFPVCGTTTFHQQTVPLCDGPSVYTGCTDGALYANRNPFWYKFTCYESGTLGFVITPLGQNEDYDWQLFDVTNLANPEDVYNDHSTNVTGNWSGGCGPTGTMGTVPSSTVYPYTTIRCSSDVCDNTPRFETMPPLIQGHRYLLLVSHYTADQSGYDLSFGGGTAVITDPLEPHLLSAKAPCDGTEIRVVTNKKMKCNSLAGDGSDWKVRNSAGVLLTAIAASSSQCANGFDLDTLSVFLSAPLAPGTYTILMETGSDGNSLKDDCDREIPNGEQQQFTVYPLYPTPLDSLTKPKCSPQTLELVFRKRIKCSSITASDFNITGPYAVGVTGAIGNCSNDGLTQTITVQLSMPLQVQGNFILHLVPGADGNTIFDECGMETPPSDIPFVIKDTVNADFTYSIVYSCTADVVSFSHNGANTVNSWTWNTSGGTPATSHAQNPVITYTNFEPKTVILQVSNGVCADTATAQLIFDNYIKADFDVSPLVCPESKAIFTNNTIGTITDWKWIMGNGNIYTIKDPPAQTYQPLEAADYTVMPQLIAKNNYGCYDTTSRPVKIVYSCFIAVPSAFTPNGDGLNDYLYPLKAYKSTSMKFSIYNRFGQRVFYSTSWLNKWDGTYRGMPQDPGTYVWTLDYMNLESGRHVVQKGTSILIR